jgi:hypothetical protein
LIVGTLPAPEHFRFEWKRRDLAHRTERIIGTAREARGRGRGGCP